MDRLWITLDTPSNFLRPDLKITLQINDGYSAYFLGSMANLERR